MPIPFEILEAETLKRTAAAISIESDPIDSPRSKG